MHTITGANVYMNIAVSNICMNIIAYMPYGPPWALMGGALMGWDLMGPLGTLWAGPLWDPLGLCGPGFHGPGP